MVMTLKQIPNDSSVSEHRKPYSILNALTTRRLDRFSNSYFERIKNADVLSKVSGVTAQTFSHLFSSFAEVSADDQIEFDFEEAASALSGP